MAKVRVVGNGAREHVLGRQLLKSNQVEKVYCAPGNPGMLESGIEIIPIGVTDFGKLVEFVQKQDIRLFSGDHLRRKEFRCLAPDLRNADNVLRRELEFNGACFFRLDASMAL